MTFPDLLFLQHSLVQITTPPSFIFVLKSQSTLTSYFAHKTHSLSCHIMWILPAMSREGKIKGFSRRVYRMRQKWEMLLNLCKFLTICLCTHCSHAHQSLPSPLLTENESSLKAWIIFDLIHDILSHKINFWHSSGKPWNQFWHDFLEQETIPDAGAEEI